MSKRTWASSLSYWFSKRICTISIIYFIKDWHTREFKISTNSSSYKSCWKTWFSCW